MKIAGLLCSLLLIFVVVWDGEDDSGRRVGSGVYFIRASMNEINLQEKVLLFR